MIDYEKRLKHITKLHAEYLEILKSIEKTRKLFYNQVKEINRSI